MLCTYDVVRNEYILRPWLWLKFGWVGGKRFFLKGLSFSKGVCMDRAICHSIRLLTFRELLAVLREVLLEIEFRIDSGASLAISSSPEPSDYGEESESEISDSDL